MSESTELNIKEYLPEIFESEAAGILQDLFFTPALAPLMMFATEAQVAVAKKYIVDVFDECYTAGHLKVLGVAGEGALYGYAMLFCQPNMELYYCHKIFVYEQYRGNGIGSDLLRHLLSQSFNFGLICLPDLVPFYKSAGLIYSGEFITPHDDEFKNARNMYLGLSVMRSADSTAGLPVFLLNDNDIRKMTELIVKCKA
ncbi:GNAT family N-acetyltransferase [Pantoea sp. A4]|uniref:GNAT family N-acetyltransferase n=1 Tax=Pantoea sp. A4 TaxID=1225184 RepID=UPI00037F24F6|nr:GNAT family N-acetyltransferase [Pantoea sp. A4]